MSRRRKAKEPRRFWTEEELRILREQYPVKSTEEVAAALKRTVRAVYCYAKTLGIAKTQDYLKANCRLQKGTTAGQATQFTKGHVPFNAGLRRPGWHAGRMRETQFKRGERTGIAAKNWRPVGTILTDGEGYQRIKVREAVHGKEATGFGNTKVWPLYSRWLWEQAYGQIPPKHLVAFKDGNRANCILENLELRSMAENARRNSMWSTMPRELALAIQLNGALRRKIRSLHGRQEQNDRSAQPSV
jgi:hypothetical protein